MRPRGLRALALVVVATVVAWGAWRLLHPPARAPFRPADRVLLAEPMYFYPAQRDGGVPRAVVFFFGNDLGFWEAHQQLAERLAANGYGVVGFDVRRTFATLPDGAPAAREAAFLERLAPLVAHARAALGGAGRPLVLGGHSIGAEVALWTAAHLHPAGLAGVLALSPGARGHLRVSLSDVTMRGEPTEPGSFAVVDQVRALAPTLRVAIVRGMHDRLGSVDPALVAAGARRFEVPFAGHSLRRLLVAGPIVETALDWVLAAPPAAPPAAPIVARAHRAALVVRRAAAG